MAVHKNTTWLISQAPWVRYRTRVELLGQSEEDEAVIKDHEDMVNHGAVRKLLEEIKDWPGRPMKRHNDANLLLHKLVFLSDLGITSDDKIVVPVIEKILDHQSTDGPFQLIGNIPTVFGGSGKDELLWMLCDAPLISYALIKMGVEDVRINTALDYLLSLTKDFGWPCAATSALGNRFKGPGRRTDPCPYANLLMLRLLSVAPELHDSLEAKRGAEMLLSLWEQRKKKKYFLFGIGTDFAKLKAPFIWFDIVHVAYVLSQFMFLKHDPRLREMIQIIEAKSDESGLFKAESVYRAWQEWDFGQKKVPSGWLTFLVYRILKNME